MIEIIAGIIIFTILILFFSFAIAVSVADNISEEKIREHKKEIEEEKRKEKWESVVTLFNEKYKGDKYYIKYCEYFKEFTFYKRIKDSYPNKIIETKDLGEFMKVVNEVTKQDIFK